MGQVVEMVRKHETVFAATEVLRMFPTFVWKAELESKTYRSINKSILRKLEAIRLCAPQPAGHGWQSGHDLHKWDEFREMKSCVNHAVKRVLEFLKIGEEKFEITGCWANMNPPEAAHGTHNHPNNFLSGVYYVQTNKGAETINFHDPRPQTEIIRPAVTSLTAENTDQVVVKVRNGTILIFPSWLKHSVDANGSDKTRISISFNVMFSAYAGTMSQPLW
jgi:uncharacterized protein (TIGR02466 family)